MSEQVALHFIQKVREDESLRMKIQSFGAKADLATLVTIGAEAGYHFTVEELQTAYKHDWRLRWLYFTSSGLQPRPGGV